MSHSSAWLNAQHRDALDRVARTLNGEVIEYEGQMVIDLGHDMAIEVCATEPAPMGFFLEPINYQLIGVWPV